MESKRRPYIPGESLKGVIIEERDRPLIEAIEEDPASYSDVEPGDLGHIEYINGSKHYVAPRGNDKTERRINVQKSYQPFDTHETPVPLGGSLEAIIEERLREVLTKEKIKSIIDRILTDML